MRSTLWCEIVGAVHSSRESATMSKGIGSGPVKLGRARPPKMRQTTSSFEDTIAHTGHAVLPRSSCVRPVFRYFPPQLLSYRARIDNPHLVSANPPSHDPIIDSLMAKPLDVESWRQVPPSPPTSTSSTTRDAFQTPFSRSTTPPFPPPEDQTIAEPRQDRPAQVLSTPRSPPKANATELGIDTSFCFLKPRPKQPLGFSYKEMFLPIDFSRNRKELEEAKTRATRLDRPTKRSRFE